MIEVKATGSPGAVLTKMASSVGAALRDGVLEAAIYQEGELKRTIFDVFPSGRTGGLARSYRTRLLGKGASEVSAGVLSSLAYAGVQDRGGTIRPTTREYLAIPLRKMAVGKWPRDFAKGELVLIKSKKGNLLLVKPTKGGRIAPYFVLKRSTTLRGKNYLAQAIDRARAGVGDILGKEVESTLDRAGV